MSEWRRVEITQTIPAHRKSWWGVWDAIVAAVKKQNRLTVPVDVTFSVLSKSDVELKVTHAQVEEGPKQ
jgi:hypothetical protein